MARTLKEIIATEKPEVAEKAKAMASEMLLNINLAELKERAELKQKALAGAKGVKQPIIEGMEKISQDMKLSSLKKYIEATGGKLHIDIEMSDGIHFNFSV